MEVIRVKGYADVKYPLNGHGPRNVKVLMDAFEHVDPKENSDIYGKGEVIEAFENKMADLLGKTSAVFYPSGTMAQQIAIRLWCEEVGSYKVAYHTLCHLEVHEEGGLVNLHPIETVLLGNQRRMLTLEDIQALDEDVKVILIELPQREIGGQVPAYEALEKISTYCHMKGIKLHLDGARLFEVLPFYNRTAAEICGLFDSVYVSFYKGIGSLAGAILAGPETFTEASKVWKRRYGGDVISLYPYIIAADYYYELRKNKFVDYYELARLLAYKLNRCNDIKTVPKIPCSNMFHVYINRSPEEVIEILEGLYKETGLGLVPMFKVTGASEVMFEYAVGDLLGKVSAHQLDKFCSSLMTAMTDKGDKDGSAHI